MRWLALILKLGKDWEKYFEILYRDRYLGYKMGRNGRKKVEDKYCLDVMAPKIKDIIVSCLHYDNNC